MKIDATVCVGCGGCVDLCPSGAIEYRNDRACIEQARCSGCLLCMQACGVEAPCNQHS